MIVSSGTGESSSGSDASSSSPGEAAAKTSSGTDEGSASSAKEGVRPEATMRASARASSMS